MTDRCPGAAQEIRLLWPALAGYNNDIMRYLALGISIFLLLITFTACGGGASVGAVNASGSNPPPPRTVNASITINNAVEGPFDLAMSTSFQPAEWDNNFFLANPGATVPLGKLQPHHIRLQTISQGVPQVSATSWNFSVLDDVTQPVLGVGDQSPEMQLGWAPAFMWSQGNMKGTLDVNAFTTYAQNMVKYYNEGGFTAADGVHASPSGKPIQWWGILNEPSINNISSSEYLNIYNTVVPAMQAVDPTLKFVALELCCSTENWTQTFAAQVTAQVDAVAAHYYSTCNQRDSDQQLFATVPGFASGVKSIYGYLAANPALPSTPVWITENNVNADFNNNGFSNCNPGQLFVTDARGTSAFFAAWRPYVFSQLGKAGAQALYHWDFDADPQYGEVNFSNAQPMLSFWVDYWLGQMFPAGTGEQWLTSTNSDSADVEVLPILNANGSVTIMIANHAVASAADNNGSGLGAHISIDVSAFSSLHSASLLGIDGSTNVANGPSQTAVPATSPISVTLNGYGVAFVKLQ